LTNLEIIKNYKGAINDLHSNNGGKKDLD